MIVFSAKHLLFLLLQYPASIPTSPENILDGFRVSSAQIGIMGAMVSSGVLKGWAERRVIFEENRVREAFRIARRRLRVLAREQGSEGGGGRGD